MRIRVFAAVVAVIVLRLGGLAEASGPWKGQVIDSETGQAIGGAVVLAAWWRRSPGAMHEKRDFNDAIEVVTDSDGRFVIPSRQTFTLSPFTRIEGPDIKIFKGGYGQWR